MENACCKFKLYLNSSENIFDIMVAAYKMLIPFETTVTIGRDDILTDIVSRFAEQDNGIQGFANMKYELTMWNEKQTDINIEEFRKKLFWLIALIDVKCAAFQYPTLPDTYVQYYSLNELLNEEIIVFPRFKSIPIDMFSKEIAKKEGKGGLFGRNYAKTADISGYIYNYIIYRPKSNIRPVLNVPSYHKKMRQRLEANNYKLKIGIFPLSNVNLNQIFNIRRIIPKESKNGLFRIESPVNHQDTLLFERCKDALMICKEQHVDIAVFPEMLFTRQLQDDIRGYVRNCQESEDKLPLFIWLGTAWSERNNQCIVIDRHGKTVFDQKKYIPYEYKTMPEEVNQSTHLDTEKDKRITLREDLARESEWLINFLDIPGLFRIATAICRDISNDYLGALLKELYCDMIIIPAFSSSNRLTKSKIDSLALDHIITVVCNACSSLCEDEQEKMAINEKWIGETLPFCYVCLPAKESENNVPDYHEVKFKIQCMECEQHCSGHFFCISFAECVRKSHYYAARVTNA